MRAVLAVLISLLAEGRAQEAPPPSSSPPLAGEVWRIPTAVLGQPGTRVVRLDAGGGPSGSNNGWAGRVGTGRLAFSLVLLPRLDLQAAAAILPLDGVHGPLDGSLRARWGLRHEGRLRLAVLGEAHFGGFYAAEHNQRRVASAETGLVITMCARGCGATASWQATVGVHDVDLRNEFVSDGHRSGHTSTAIALTVPLPGGLGLFVAARAATTFACSVRHGQPRCGSDRTAAGTVGGRASWSEDRYALDLGFSILGGPVLGPGGPTTATTYLVGAMFASSWDRGD